MQFYAVFHDNLNSLSPVNRISDVALELHSGIEKHYIIGYVSPSVRCHVCSGWVKASCRNGWRPHRVERTLAVDELFPSNPILEHQAQPFYQLPTAEDTTGGMTKVTSCLRLVFRNSFPSGVRQLVHDTHLFTLSDITNCPGSPSCAQSRQA